MSVNRIDATLTDDQRDRVNAALAALAEALPLSDRPERQRPRQQPQVRRQEPRLCRQGPRHREAYPDLLPPGFNFQEFRNDLAKEPRYSGQFVG